MKQKLSDKTKLQHIVKSLTLYQMTEFLEIESMCRQQLKHNHTLNTKYVFYKVENIVGKGENVGYEK